jgi:hypothetical protein
MNDWKEGFAAGYAQGSQSNRTVVPKVASKRATKSKPKRKASAYSVRYGKAFKRLAPKYKLKSGSWKKNGFRLCAKAARKVAKK